MSLTVPASDGAIPMDRIGCVHLPAPLDAVIDVWWLRQYAGGLFLPLPDGTAGWSSYGGGRYGPFAGRHDDDFRYPACTVPASVFRHALGTDPRISEYQLRRFIAMR